MAEWDSQSYGRVNSLQELVAQQALSGLTLAGTERVLDVGCGDGRVTELLAARLTTGSLVGVDPSNSMIEAARARFAGDDRCTFALGTAATLSFEPDFDLVVSFNALHWEIRWPAALARIRAALRPGGRAFLVFVCDGDRPSLEDVLTETAAAPRWRDAFNDFTPPYVHVDPDEYATVAQRTGFAVESREVVDLEWDFGDRTAFAAWVSAGTVAWTAQLPEHDRAGFVADAIEAYAEVSGSDSRFRFLQGRFVLLAA